ncbi:MAG: VCBS repeat-containing protein, partial [Polyangiaceae bacterium]
MAISLSRRLVVLTAVLSCALPSVVEAKTYFTEVGGNPLGTDAQWTNYIRLADLDADGDLDVIVPNCGGFFSNPQAQPLRIYRNDGAFQFSDATNAFLGMNVVAAVRVVAVGDIDRDGDLDLFLPSAAGEADMLFVNAGQGQFSDEASVRLPGGGTKSHAAAARFGDVDGDG